MKRAPTVSELLRLAQVQDVTVRYEGRAAERVAELFGRAIPDEQLAAAFGALDGATVSVAFNANQHIEATITHPQIAAQIRTLRMDAQGELFLRNEFFRTRDDAPKGLGTYSFARQVAGARALGIRWIETFAAGSKASRNWNGYYTWPRLGYNAELTSDEELLLQYLRGFRGVRDLNDLILRGGAAWWAEKGDGREMVFHLDGRYRSVRILLRYLREKGLL